MVITCQQCAARLQLDDAKVPQRAFTVRCPKCQHIINAQPPAQAPDSDPSEQGAPFLNGASSALRCVVPRRPFFLPLTPAGRTGDPPAAPIRSATSVLTPADIEDLPRALDRALRDFNELYRNYN